MSDKTQELIELAIKAEGLKKGTANPAEINDLKEKFNQHAEGLSEKDLQQVDLYSRTTKSYSPKGMDFENLQEKGANLNIVSLGYVKGVINEVNQTASL
jgi:hypothetical protein